MWKASTIYWIVQLLGWGLFCVLLAITNSAFGKFNTKVLIQLIQLYILLIAISHGMRYILLKFDWINFKLGPMIPRVLLLNYLSSIVLLTSTFLLSALYTDNEDVNYVELFINTWVYTIFFMLWTAIYLTYHLIKKSREQEMVTLKLKASNHEIELKTLREQLNPHFLFNSLNSIRALIEEEPKTAKHAITTLSNLLRNSLQMGKTSQVKLSEELELVNKYLELEKIRFEERLNFQIVSESPGSIHIPPFIIQTLAENAVKHGISKLAKGGTIKIHTSLQDEVLIISVENTGSLNLDKNGTQIGLSNTKRRLLLQYGAAAQFSIFQLDNVVKAQIKIDFEKIKNKAQKYESNTD